MISIWIFDWLLIDFTSLAEAGKWKNYFSRIMNVIYNYVDI